jgi:hypothetical protein
MSPCHGRRSVARWIALFAILVVTFAPSVTGLLSASRGQLWDQVCSSTSPVVKTAASNRDGTPATTPHAFEHCPYCALHADLAPPPGAAQADSGAVPASPSRTGSPERPPRAQVAWAGARPRAPPFFG